MKIDEHLKDKIRLLPENPGIYKYYDATGELIYVGKAKNIKKRVSSYFNKHDGQDRKTRRLVSQIQNVEYTIVNTELDALLLENNLIKENQPKYNIMLKDDKSYPFICVTDERFPKIYPTRQRQADCHTYFGPYASLRTMNTLLELLRKLFTFRTCNYQLSQENIAAKKFKVCLEYHLGNCKGPCEARQTEDEYNYELDQALHILKGNLAVAKNYFKEQMSHSAAAYEFEKAQSFKDKLHLLDSYQSKSVIVNPDMDDMDVCTISSDEKCAYINCLGIAKGTINQTLNLSIKKKLDESDEDILTMAIVNFRSEFGSSAKEILTNIPVELPLPGINAHVPQRGDKRKLVDLSIKNVLYYKKEKTLKAAGNAGTDRKLRVLQTLQADLGLKELPIQIECFDNSNIQGTNPVAAMVCFKNGLPSKKDYRHFNIKTVEGPNDYASMTEVVFRRYRRLLDEVAPLPQLIVIDGGKGQLSAACDSLKQLDLYGKIPIIGIAKRLEEIYYPEDPIPLHIDKKSESLKLIQRLRDEAHRFAIEFHRDQRSKASLKTGFEDIRGIGKDTIEKLYKHFKSLNKITPERYDEVVSLIGTRRADLIMSYVKAKKREPKM
jgi:excinuclease ABC subunit C